MPVTPTYPGVYIEELSSGVRTISGVATSITAFVGYTARGLDNRAKRLFSFADFERSFGGLASDSELSYAVKHFFDNGGGDAYVVRVPKASPTTVPAGQQASVAASVTLMDAASATANAALRVTALSKGAWANRVLIDVDYDNVPATDNKTFNLTITDLSTGTVETFSNVTMDSARSNYVVAVVNDEDNGSQMVNVQIPVAVALRPVQTGTVGGVIVLADIQSLSSTQDHRIKIGSDLVPLDPDPAVTDHKRDLIVIANGEEKPTSVMGLCRLLERKINQALQNVPGARVRCVPGASGKGIRVFADFDQTLLPNTLDAILTLEDGSANSILPKLKLETTAATENASVNVAHYVLGAGRTGAGAPPAQTGVVPGVDGTILPGSQDLIGKPSDFSGIYALDKVDLFNILCIPDATRAMAGNPNQLDPGVDPNSIFGAALDLCQKKRAFLVIDPPPNIRNVDTATDWKSSGLTVHDKNAAAYFPRVRVPDPLNDFQLRTFAPSGLIAGLYARTDVERGVWKAPAGTEATLRGVQGLVYKLSDPENGALNPLGLNCLREFPVYGRVAWGARTLVGADAEGSEWKYVPIRRLALYLEESLYRGTKWVVFEPNDEPLWAQIRLNIGAFMQSLFLQGAFQGKTPREAYLVRCDKTTTTQNDIDRGIVNIVVGFAPLKPAEFVIIKIQQLAGQLQA